VSAYN